MNNKAIDLPKSTGAPGRASPTAEADPPAGSGVAAAGALSTQLAHLETLLSRLSDEQYRRAPVGAFHSPIGAHVRHCLDHIQAFCTGAPVGRLDYDDRRRGTEVETCRSSALRAVGFLRGQLGAVRAIPLGRPVRVSSLLEASGPPLELASSVGREWSFLISHTIHHGAILAALARALGVEPPATMGFAPATLAHLQRQSCAP